MMLTVTRPLEQAIMECRASAACGRAFRGATEISAQFEPSTEMIRRCSSAEPRRAPDLPGDVDLAVDRLTPTAFPFFMD